MKTGFRDLILLAACVMLVQASQAQTIPPDTAVHTGKLSNGFTYYIRHNNEPKNRVYMYLVNDVGSVLEDDDQQGLAHFMEHMNFNGTKHFPKNKLVDYLQRAGIRFGADLNAYTNFDETVFQLPLPADDPKLVDTGLEIMRDWAQEATLDSAEIQKERGVVLSEKRNGLGARERMQRQYWPVLLNHSRYADRLPIGKENILLHFKPATLRSFHHDWYRPDLQALIVVGDIDPVKIEAQVKKAFSTLKNPAHERPRTKYQVPLTGQNNFLAVTDKEMPVTVLQVIIKHKEPELRTYADYIAAMQRSLFNRMLSGRFVKLSQQPDPPFVRATAGIGGFIGGLNMFSFSLTAKKGRLKQGFESGWELVEQAKRYGFTRSELDRARKNYLAGMETAYKERNKTSSVNFVKEYQRLFLKQEAAPGIAWEYQFVKSHIDSISLDDINQVARRYITGANRDILILAPDSARKHLPDSATVAGWLQEVDREKIVPYKDEVINRPLLSSIPRPGSLVSKKQLKELGITELAFGNGVKVLLKPTDFKNDQVLFTAFKPGGTCLYDDSDYVAANNAVNIIGSFGAGDFTPIQLRHILTGKQLHVSPYMSSRHEGIGGSARPRDLETALQLVYLRFTAPREDSGLFENIIGRSATMLASRYSTPGNVFADTMNYVLGSYSYRRSAPSLEKLNSIRMREAYDIYKERFGDASGFTFVFVGSFNPDSIEPLLARYIGSLPGTGKGNISLPDRGIRVPKGYITKTVRKGSEDRATVRMIFSGEHTYDAATNLQLRALAAVMQIKVLEHLREDKSEVYSPRVQASASKYPVSRYELSASFSCAPGHVNDLEAGVEREIKAIATEGPDPVDVEKFKAEYARTHEVQMQNNSYWLNYITNRLENKEDLHEILQSKQLLATVTPASIRALAKKILSDNNEIKFVLLPEK